MFEKQKFDFAQGREKIKKLEDTVQMKAVDRIELMSGE